MDQDGGEFRDGKRCVAWQTFKHTQETSPTLTSMIFHMTTLELLFLISLFIGPWLVFPLTFFNLPMMLSTKAGASFKVFHLLWCACYVVPEVMALNWWGLRRSYSTSAELATPVIWLATAAPLMTLVQFVYLLKRGMGRE